MKERRHHNNKGLRQTHRGKTREQVERMAKRLGLPFHIRKPDPMQKHFVTFFSPGTFVHEATTKPIDAWDTDTALEMSKDIVERYGARPFGFKFTTRARGPEDLDAAVVATSPMHYIGGKIETREEVFARNDPDERILRANMENNDVDRIWVSTSGYKTTVPLRENDVIVKPA